MTDREFDEWHKDAPAERREMLRAFRAAYPYRRRRVDGAAWSYVDRAPSWAR